MPFCFSFLMKETARYSRLIKFEARKLGFLKCGIARADRLYEEEPRLKSYLDKGFHGKMAYMENHFSKRVDPRLLVEGAKSVIVLAYNYFPSGQQSDPTAPILSKYAYGDDYHFIVKEKLKKLFRIIEQKCGAVNGRYFVDSAPVLERAWAQRAGLGWIGKNANLISQEHGSFFFLAEIICDLELDYDAPVVSRCGSCTQCIDACPTGAIVEDHVVDGSKCISYFTIELRDKVLPAEMKGRFQNRVFGCDICQDVCPWNRFSLTNTEPAFQPSGELMNLKRKEWLNMDKNEFNKLFKNSAVKRARFSGIKRNLEFIRDDHKEVIYSDTSREKRM